MAKEQVSTVLRALDVLECFMDHTREWTLKMIAERVGLPTTTVYRQLTTLTERQYLTYDRQHKIYRVGPRFLLLCSTIVGHSDLRQIARPELESLSERAKETINLSMLLDHDIFYLDKVESRRSIVCNTRVGSRVPAYATGCGKVMLAFQLPERVQAYCAWMEQHAVPLTERTVTTPECFMKELLRARQEGYAVDDGEIERGLICFAAPIRDMNGQVIAAVSVSGPEFRMRQEQDFMIRQVRQSAAVISSCMGYSEQTVRLHTRTE